MYFKLAIKYLSWKFFSYKFNFIDSHVKQSSNKLGFLLCTLEIFMSLEISVCGSEES